MKRVGYYHLPFGSLVVLQQRCNYARERKARAVERVDKLGLPPSPGTEPDIDPPRLECLEVADRRDFEPPLLADGPDFEVVLLRLRETHVSRAHQKDPVPKPELLKKLFSVAPQRLKLVVRHSRMDELHQFHLVELMQAVESAYVFSIRAGFTPEAWS